MKSFPDRLALSELFPLPYPDAPSGEIASERHYADRSSGWQSANELSALNWLIANRELTWSKKAREIKFDVEFKAIEEERRRVAKELHDDILPLLSRLARSIQAHGAAKPLVDEVYSVIAVCRDLLGELHPVDLEELGLVPALSNLCRRYARGSQRSIAFVERTEECGLNQLQQLCLYRAVQAILKMFANSRVTAIAIQYLRTMEASVIAVRVAALEGRQLLLSRAHEFDAFKSWCSMAGAEVITATDHSSEHGSNLLISISNDQPDRSDVQGLIGELTRARLEELEKIMQLAQAEWAAVIRRDCSLFREMAIEIERKRISQELNTLVVPRLENVIRLSEQSSSSELRLEVLRRMQAVAAGVRNLMSGLCPRRLAQSGIVSSLRSLVARFRRATMINTKLIISPHCENLALPVEEKLAIYRVTQEALNNVEKHADATEVHITINYDQGVFWIRVEDNGKGFQTAATRLSRGLKNIRDRACAIGATVSWQRAPSFSTGTIVCIALDVNDNTSGITPR